jgi:hypothetical protein
MRTSDDSDDGSQEGEEIESAQMKKCRKLEMENDKLKGDVKKLKGHCKTLTDKLKVASTKVLDMAACGKQDKTKKEETNLKVAKHGM